MTDRQDDAAPLPGWFDRLPTELVDWLAGQVQWFDRRPEREYRFAKLRLRTLRQLSRAGLITGTMDDRGVPGAVVLSPSVRVNGKPVECVLSRSGLEYGRAVPGVLVLGNEAPCPPLPANAEPDRLHEQAAGAVWHLHARAIASGMTLREVMAATLAEHGRSPDC